MANSSALGFPALLQAEHLSQPQVLRKRWSTSRSRPHRTTRFLWSLAGRRRLLGLVGGGTHDPSAMEIEPNQHQINPPLTGSLRERWVSELSKYPQ